MAKEHQTKQFIRNAARKLFAERGYNAVAIRDIAAAIGKQPGGLYNHFGSKQAILVDLMQENLERAEAAAIAPLADLSDPADRLEAFVRGHIAHNIANPDDIFIAYMELRSLEGAGSKQIMAQRDAYEATLRGVLRDGQANGAFVIADPAIQARAILSMLGGITVWYRQTGPQSPADITECYVQAALQSVGVTYTAPSER
ncbi:TetR/AcrR family transcriptional regulator [Pseudooctadecabacter sp.]|uniref:TetR/AcrR family transcriptional regulator n=1 Tax=Pseudooctadecabacter sp. TaxID=1966338 RepID=UPI0025F527EE|nr:TetR/AcrR family transcriptional regulator [Pseudooctadecabacter sp.]